MTDETMNVRLARLLTENPELPIKVSIDGDVGEWRTSELNRCNVTEYTNYGPGEQYYFRCDSDRLFQRIRDNIWCAMSDVIYTSFMASPNSKGTDVFSRVGIVSEMTNYVLPDEKLDYLAQEVIDTLEWKPCILLKVGL